MGFQQVRQAPRGMHVFRFEMYFLIWLAFQQLHEIDDLLMNQLVA